MNRKIFILLFISFVSVCFVVGFWGINAIAADGDREGQAYERETQCIGMWCFETGRQWTSEYDAMMGNYFPNISYTTMRPNYQASSPLSSSYSYEGSGIGGFTRPMFSIPTSPMLSLLGYMGAPRTQIQQSQDPFWGSMSMSSIYPGFGGGGFMLGPYSSNIWGGGWNSLFSGLSGGFGFPGLTGGYTGSYPTRLF